MEAQYTGICGFVKQIVAFRAKLVEFLNLLKIKATNCPVGSRR